MSAATILNSRAQIAESVAHFIRTKDANGWSTEGIAEHLQQRVNPNITAKKVRKILALPC